MRTVTVKALLITIAAMSLGVFVSKAAAVETSQPAPYYYDTPVPYYSSPDYDYYTKSHYYTSTTCEAATFDLERDEYLLKSMYKAGKCTEVPANYEPDLKAINSGACYYKTFGISCSSVNDDCKYVDAKSYCAEDDLDCHMISQVSLWNRPMRSGGEPITFEEITASDDVISQPAEQTATSVKPIKNSATMRHNDQEVWWREVYYFCRQGNFSEYSQYLNKKKLISTESSVGDSGGVNDWIRGEVGHECKCDSRLGYYYYMGEREHEAEWTVPGASPEQWREFEPASGESLDRWRLRN